MFNFVCVGAYVVTLWLRKNKCIFPERKNVILIMVLLHFFLPVQHCEK